jgi:hypothetical protein
MTIKDRGRVYPQYLPNVSRFGTAHPEYSGGMTLRDHFAAKAMQGLMDAAMPMSEIAKEAYLMADLMLKAREPK